MNDDVVTRLRGQRTNSVICNEAADEIERLQADVERWREFAEAVIQNYGEDVGHKPNVKGFYKKHHLYPVWVSAKTNRWKRSFDGGAW